MDILSHIGPTVRDEWAKKSRAAIYRNDPVAWMREIAGFHPWSKQRDLAYSVRDNRATAVASAHATGKTLSTAYIICWWIDVHPLDEVFVATTAPSQDQVRLVWDYVRTIKARIDRRYAEGVIDHKLPGYITGENAWKLDDGRMIGQGRKPPDNKSDVAFQGRHADYLLAIADEAVGVPAGILEGLGNIATGVNNRQLLIANPTNPSCWMAKIWRDENPMWNRMHISVMDSPTITPDPEFQGDTGGMSGPEFVEQKLAEYGSEDDPRFIARVLGQWAFDSGNNVFTPEELGKARDTEVRPDPDATPVMGLDIARMGGDSSCLYQVLEGDVWREKVDPDGVRIGMESTGERGYQLRVLDEWRKAPVSGNDPNNLGTAQRAHQHMLATGAKILKLDAAGIGAGVIDGLKEIERDRGGMPYYWFEVYGQSTTGIDKRAYSNARAANFFRIKDLMNKGILDIDPNDEELLEELEGIVFEFDARGKILIESKDNMKRRGVKSPDHADAAWYALMEIPAAKPPSKFPIEQLPPRNYSSRRNARNSAYSSAFD